MEEILKALSPWPLLEGIVLGCIVAAGAIWAINRGLRDSRNDRRVNVENDMDRQRAEWAAYEQLRNIEQNTFKIVDTQTRMVDAVNRLVDVIWNRRQ